MRNVLITIATLTLAARLHAAEPELKGSAAELTAYLAGLPKMVSVTGESELKVPADRAVVTLKVTTEYKSLQETLRANQELRAKIANTLKERGIGADRIQASKFSSTAKIGVFTEKAKSYRVENCLKVKTQDEKEFQAVAQVVDSMPEVQYHGVEFEQSDKDALKNKALGQAIEKATERKRVFEERLGVKLVPKAFTQAGSEMEKSPTLDYKRVSSKGTMERYDSRAGETMAVAEETGSLFGELLFKARVTVEYAVEAK